VRQGIRDRTAEQADCLRVLERAESLHTAARARVLSAFHARGGCDHDGHGSTTTWLKWQTRITGGAAAGAAWGPDPAVRRRAGRSARSARQATAPEDLRSKWQRGHDALEEACRLLVVSRSAAGDAFALPQASVGVPV
jgi:hypothetical protein